MPAILTDPAQLAAAHSRFVQTLQTALTQTIPCTVSGVGGGLDTEAAYSPELDLWYAQTQDGKKCWNGFGLASRSLHSQPTACVAAPHTRPVN